MGFLGLGHSSERCVCARRVSVRARSARCRRGNRTPGRTRRLRIPGAASSRQPPDPPDPGRRHSRPRRSSPHASHLPQFRLLGVVFGDERRVDLSQHHLAAVGTLRAQQILELRRRRPRIPHPRPRPGSPPRPFLPPSPPPRRRSPRRSPPPRFWDRRSPRAHFGRRRSPFPRRGRRVSGLRAGRRAPPPPPPPAPTRSPATSPPFFASIFRAHRRHIAFVSRVSGTRSFAMRSKHRRLVFGSIHGTPASTRHDA